MIKLFLLMIFLPHHQIIVTSLNSLGHIGSSITSLSLELILHHCLDLRLVHTEHGVVALLFEADDV
jgi:hypothetical protein